MVPCKLHTFIGLITLLLLHATSEAQQGVCLFRGEPSPEKIIRLSENTPVGSEIYRLSAYPRRNFNIQAIDGSRELSGFFSFHEIDRKQVGIILQRSLQDLVDQSAPVGSIHFRLACRGISGDTDYLPVTVYIEDENDNAPEFIGAPYNIVVDELTPQGLTIFRGIQALDRDKPNTANSEVVYSIINGNEERKFSIESTSKKAVLVLRKTLDYDGGERLFNITIRAQDRGSPSLSSSTYVLIHVKDGDDLSPVFSKDVYVASIQEDYPITGEKISKLIVLDHPISAVDQDVSINASLKYSIVDGNDGGFFSLDPRTGQLYQIKEIDLESMSTDKFELDIEAVQLDNPLKNAQSKVIIHIDDVNDNLAVFDSDSLNITLHEHMDNGQEVIKVNATDLDKGNNGKFFYILEDPSGAFEIDARSGIVRVKNSALFDREKFENLQMKVGAQQMTRNVLSAGNGNSGVNIHIHIEDTNDNSPVFVPSNTYVFSVSSNSIKSGLVLGSVLAKDADQGPNGEVRYHLKQDTEEAKIFKVSDVNGEISLATHQPLKQKRYVLYVTAIDQGEPVEERRTSMAIVEIRVEGDFNARPLTDSEAEAPGVPQQAPVVVQNGRKKEISTDTSEFLKEQQRKERLAQNDQHPVQGVTQRSRAPLITLGPWFVHQLEEFQIDKNARPGTPVGRPKVEGLSSDGSSVRWAMMHRYKRGVPFNIHVRSGVISVARPMDDDLQSYTVKIFVESEGKNASTKVRIHLIDLANADPTKETSDSEVDGDSESSGDDDVEVDYEAANERSENFAFTVKENFGGALVANLTLLAFQRKDPNFLEYVITNEEAKDKFSITDNGLLHTKVALDRETKDTYDVVIAMGKRGVIRGKEVLRVKVVVEDENDNSPVFDRHIYQGTIRKTAASGSEVSLGSTLHVSDLDLNDKLNLKLLGKGSGLFRLEPETGRVFLNGTLTSAVNDEKFYLRLRATDEAGHITESQLVIHVLKDLDTPPIVRGLAVIDGNFVTLSADGTMSIKENAPVGTRIAKLVVTDQKSSRVEKDLVFSLVSEKVEVVEELLKTRHPKRQTEQSEKHFSIEESTGDLVILRRLSLAERYTLNISVLDTAGFKADTLIVATVEDVNDHSPVFSKELYEFRIPEGTYSRTKLGEVLASDGDLGSNAEIVYQLAENDSQNHPIIIDSRDGSVYVQGTLDREAQSEFTFQVTARDGGNKSVEKESTANLSRCNITVFVIDANDNPPVFYGYTRLRRKDGASPDDLQAVMPIYTAEVDESFPAESEFLRVFANDTDVGLNGLVTYELLNHKNKFRLDNFSGSLTTIEHLNFNEANVYDLSILAVDRGRPSLRSMAAVIVQVKKSKTGTNGENISAGPTGVARPFVDDEINEDTKSKRPKIQKKLFSQSSVSVEVPENVEVPVVIVDLKTLLVDNENVIFDLGPADLAEIFKIDQKSGHLMLVDALDREQRSTFSIQIRCVERPEIAEREVPVFFYTLYIQNVEQQNLAEDQLQVDVVVTDANDNVPEFLTFENPVQVSISNSLQPGDIIAKMEAWDADEGINAHLKYELNHLSSPSVTPDLFEILSTTGDVILKNSIKNFAGKSFQMEAIATDHGGSPDGLMSKLGLIVYVISQEYQLKVVLSNQESEVVKEAQNITRILSEITGLAVKIHQVEEHRSGFGVGIPVDPNTQTQSKATDVYIFGANNDVIVTAEYLLRKLSLQLNEAKSKLAQHGLIEIQAGSQPYSSDPSPSQDGNNAGHGNTMGSVEIAILGMACAVFFGALIAVVSVFCIRAKRKAKSESGNYPAPLAIPLPSYSVEPSMGPQSGILSHSHPSLHHGDLMRQSGKSNSKGMHPIFNNNHMGLLSFHKSLDTSEETSDTCVDENPESQSSGPSSGGIDCFQRRPGGHSSRRSRVKVGQSSKSPDKRRSNLGVNNTQGNRSRDSGLNDRRESFCCSCQHSSRDSCDSCSEGSDENFAQTPKGTSVHFSQHLKSSSFRRHKSASPSRAYRSHFNSTLPTKGQGGPHLPHLPQQVCHCQLSAYQSLNSRSKSTGQLPGDGDDEADASALGQQVCSCSSCHSRSRSRSKSSGQDHSERSSCQCCDGVDRGGLCRHSKASQSARSTRWEVYQHSGSDTAKSGQNFQPEISPDRESVSLALRTAYSTATKALSWRGDHPMKNEIFFNQQIDDQSDDHPIKTPQSTRLSHRSESKSRANSKVAHHGVKLVGL